MVGQELGYVVYSVCAVTNEVLGSFKLAPNMLKNLPIIPSQTFQNFYPLFFFIPIVPPIIPFLFFCASDNITMQE